MKLNKYLETTNISIARFARACDIHENTMFTYVKEKAEPSLANALKIEEASHGAITLPELILERPTRKVAQEQ